MVGISRFKKLKVIVRENRPREFLSHYDKKREKRDSETISSRVVDFAKE